MNPQERKVIDDLFDKLRDAEQQTSPREPVAEAHINARIERQPGAPYLMAQTIVVQEQALEAAQARLAALENELERRPAAGGGFLSSLFGGSGASQQEANGPQGAVQPATGRGTSGFAARQGMAQARQQQSGRGGGFLAGAAQTAMGVAGGMLLGSMIGSAFAGGGSGSGGEGSGDGAGGEAEAAPAAEPEQLAADEGTADFGDDFGGDI